MDIARTRTKKRRIEKTALQLWAFPKSNYQSFQQLLTAYTLEDDYCFTGKNILKFQFQGVEQTVKNWTDFFQKYLLCFMKQIKQY